MTEIARAVMLEECLYCGAPAEVAEVVALGSAARRPVRCVLGTSDWSQT